MPRTAEARLTAIEMEDDIDVLRAHTLALIEEKDALCSLAFSALQALHAFGLCDKDDVKEQHLAHARRQMQRAIRV